MYKIIIAEDSITQAEHLISLLRNNGHQVIHGKNGKEALKLVKETENVDLVITDLIMPEMNGYELCESIKSNERTKKTPVILLTSLDKITDIIRGLAVNADTYITKPIDEELLINCINNVLNPKILTSYCKENKIKIDTGSEEFSLMANPKQSIDFLLSTYEASIHINNSLSSTQKKLEELNNELTKEGFMTSKQLRKEIAKRQEAMKQLKITLEKAKSADRLKTSFLNNLSHEIRTPMNAIVGFSELLQDQEIEYSERESFIKYISRSAYNLLEIIENIVEAALVESEEIKIVEQNCNLNELFENVFKAYCTKIESIKKENIEFSYYISEALQHKNITFAADKVRIILKKLLSNAFKFTEKGEIKFGVSTIDNNNNLKFFVEDTGIGIPQEKQNEVFDKFIQLEDIHTKKYSGTGIGLSTTKKLIECLNGKIEVESTEGNGSKFYFSLPFKENQNEELLNDHHKNDMNTEKHKKRKILIAEDVETNYLLLKTVFDKKGIDIIWAKDGKQAVHEFEENTSIDLILMDIQMPIMNGIEASEKIKAIDPYIPIIALTAFASEIKKEFENSKLFDKYLVKPILPSKIFHIVDNMLKNKRKAITNE